MKFSIYNSAINIINKHTLLYNSFSGTFVVVRNRLINLKGLTIEKTYLENKSLYYQLIDAGIIIDDNIDEVSQLYERINKSDNNEREYILHINPTLDCNFRCWYCYEQHVPNSKMNSVTLNAVLKYIDTVLQKPSIRFFELGFFGGEPLLYFNSVAKKIIIHTDSLCKTLNKSLHIHFTSNGALLNDNIVSFLSNFSCGFQITLDGGKIAHDKTRFNKDNSGSFKKIINNILHLVNSGIDVIIRVNFTSENVNDTHTIYKSVRMLDQAQRKHIRFDFQRVWQDRSDRFDETESRIQDIRHFFKEQGFIVLANYIPHDVRNSCYGDKLNHVLVNYNGDVFGCTARDFTSDNRIGFIDESGIIHYDTIVTEKRNRSKLSKEVCKECRIAPICGGGCKQRAYESLDSESCTLNYSEEDINNLIMEIFEYSISQNSNNLFSV